METMEGNSKAATMKRERMEGPAGTQAEADSAAGSRGHGAGSAQGPREEAVPGVQG